MAHTTKPSLFVSHRNPTGAEELAILEAVARQVAWEKAMTAQGVQVYKLDLTAEETQKRADIWFNALHHGHDHQR